MSTPRIYADFQNLDEDNRLKLTCVGTLADVNRQSILLQEGLALTLYTDDADEYGNPDDLCADGIVQYNAVEQCWVAAVDWNRLYHTSEETARNGAGKNQRSTAGGQEAEVPGRPG